MYMPMGLRIRHKQAVSRGLGGGALLGWYIRAIFRLKFVLMNDDAVLNVRPNALSQARVSPPPVGANPRARCCTTHIFKFNGKSNANRAVTM